MANFTHREVDKDADLEFGRVAHHAAYRDVVTRQFGSWNESVQDGFFRDGWNRAPHKVLMVDGAPIGICSSAVNQDHVFLSELQILPEFQGQGIGTAVVQELMSEAKKLGLPLRLQVLRENKAQELYRRLGFIVTGSTDFHVKMEWKG